mmetsp:Transcript_9722/g.11131  ORF Transcript_9722/g.11131 Transcript_9722/m.11131 type:complete len:80 (-) Transcript_9722:89-328(-)
MWTQSEFFQHRLITIVRSWSRQNQCRCEKQNCVQQHDDTQTNRDIMVNEDPTIAEQRQKRHVFHDTIIVVLLSPIFSTD